MMIYDDTYSWQGWGGKLRLGSGRCRLRIFDIGKGDSKVVTHLKSIIVVVSDIPFEKVKPNQMTIKSCASHIATCVVKDFKIDPHRMLWIEYYPKDENKEIKYSKEYFDAVEFKWNNNFAIQPKWKPLNPAMLDLVFKLLNQH
ncbi:Uncharacterized protein dnl_21740 [Desulfonema limicola]|uniref:Uncharacterized protein n=1 Tax=Desulfonema limicola TaxID=45656 RepID=A0A975B731_9BACT|nr:hypothetical protein [Desulfonema limicola]QTA79892.1 Uncharacterized protein dnl_21740 [Desulfonema limicola]